MEGCTYICAYYTYLYMYNIFTWNFFATDFSDAVQFQYIESIMHKYTSD